MQIHGKSSIFHADRDSPNKHDVYVTRWRAKDGGKKRRALEQHFKPISFLL